MSATALASASRMSAAIGVKTLWIRLNSIMRKNITPKYNGLYTNEGSS